MIWPFWSSSFTSGRKERQSVTDVPCVKATFSLPPQAWSRYASRIASTPGWWNGITCAPGPSRIWSVLRKAWAISRSGAGIGSHGTVKCSPTHASAYPS